jgi:hypothetical protein
MGSTHTKSPGGIAGDGGPGSLVGEKGEGPLCDLSPGGRGGGLDGLLEGVASGWSTERHDGWI